MQRSGCGSQLSADRGVHRSVEKLGASGGRLAHQEKAAGLNQENCDSHAALQSSDSVAGRCATMKATAGAAPKKRNDSGAECGVSPCSPNSTRHRGHVVAHDFGFGWRVELVEAGPNYCVRLKTLVSAALNIDRRSCRVVNKLSLSCQVIAGTSDGAKEISRLRTGILMGLRTRYPRRARKTRQRFLPTAAVHSCAP